MARYNVFRSKRKFFITLLSLFLGCEMALLTAFISKGTDIMGQLSQKPDFKIGTGRKAVDSYLNPYRNVEQLHVDRNKALFDEAFLKKLMNVKELDKKSVKKIYGCYASYDYSDDWVEPIEDATYSTGKSNDIMTIQVVNDQYIQKLEKYTKRNQLGIDTDSLRDGKGILVLHKHELSEILEEEANAAAGDTALVYSGQGEGNVNDDGVKFVCSGYLDTTQKGFPPLDMSWNGDARHYFLVGEKGFERLEAVKPPFIYPRQVFAFTVNAKKGQEALAKAKLKELIRKKNSEHKAANIYYLASTSDEIAKVKNYADSSRTVMIALCLSLFLLGIINYLNVLITNMISRKKEFAMMESVGMTKKQLKRMFIREGVYYWGFLMITLVSAGTLVITGAGVIIRGNLPDFRFVYPVKEGIGLAVTLLLCCVFLPQIVYKKTSHKSAIEQLKDE